MAKQSGKHVRSIHFPGIYPHKNYPQLCTARDIHSLLHQALCDLALFQLPPYLLLPCYSSHSSPPGALNMGALPPPPAPCPPGSHVQVPALRSATQGGLLTPPSSLLKLMCSEWVMLSNHLILCHPLLLSPSIFPSISVFSHKSALCIRWLKYGCPVLT